MKKQILLMVSILGLCACATWQQQQVDWRGRNFDDYVQSKGVPTSKYSLQNGNTVYSFKTTCRYANMMGETHVTVGADNLIMSVSTSTKCPSYYESSEYTLDQIYQQGQQRQAQLELEKSERAQKIKTLEGALRGVDMSISYDKNNVEYAQSDLDFATKWGNEESRAKAERELKEAQNKLREEEQRKAEWKRELQELKSRQYR